MMALLSKKISQAEESAPSSCGGTKELSHCLDIYTSSNSGANVDKGCNFTLVISICTSISVQ